MCVYTETVSFFCDVDSAYRTRSRARSTGSSDATRSTPISRDRSRYSYTIKHRLLIYGCYLSRLTTKCRSIHQREETFTTYGHSCGMFA